MRVFGFGLDEKVKQYNKIAAWLANHPDLWKRKHIARHSPEWSAIAKAVRAAGFYSVKTVDADIKVDKLVALARRA